jgi:integrase family protein with SAM-like domain
MLDIVRAPALVAAAGGRASYRLFEFFTAQIRNPNTRRAYARAAVEFFDWLAIRGVTAIESVHIAAYIEQLQKARSAPTAKLRLAVLRHLFGRPSSACATARLSASCLFLRAHRRGHRHARRGRVPAEAAALGALA